MDSIVVFNYTISVPDDEEHAEITLRPRATEAIKGAE